MKILHITAHLGGGVGSAFAGLGACGHEQRILSLEQTLNQTNSARVEAAGFRLLDAETSETVRRELLWADITVFSWYHHPAFTKFLREMPPIPIRSILWYHASGNYFPYIPAEMVQKFDQCIFTTPFTLELPQIRNLGTAYRQMHFDVVYGLNDLSRFFQIEKLPHTGFRIGYVGTLGFSKLHPRFVDYCAAVELPQAEFVMAGTPSTRETLLASARERGIDGQFRFLGQLSDTAPVLAQMDVFGYLLNPQHFGTTENALLEAMAAGIPVVALDQCVERQMIQHGKTGLLVHSPQEYGEAVRYLYRNPEAASRLALQAREDVARRYDCQGNRNRFLSACERALHTEKHIHRFDDFFTGEPADWFLSCVHEDRVCFEEDRPQDTGEIFRSPTKGSPIHYHAYFPQDQRLARWAAKLEEERFNKQGSEEKIMELLMPEVTFFVTFNCTLKCKRCMVGAPYLRKDVREFSFEEIEASIDRYFKIIPHVKMATISGGEPLLFPRLAEVISCIKKYESQADGIRMVTNGTLIPDQKVLDAMKTLGDKFYIIADDYGTENSKRIDELDRVLTKNGIRHVIRNYTKNQTYYGGWIDCGDLTEKKHAQKDAERLYAKCVSICYMVSHGKMWSCAVSHWRYQLGLDYDESEYIDLLDDTLSIQEQQGRLRNLLKKKSLTACAYCNGFCADSERFLPAEQLLREESQCVQDGAKSYAEVQKMMRERFTDDEA